MDEFYELLLFICRNWIPWLLYAFVFLSLVPKSWRLIRTFAHADEASNAGKYHRCYAPEFCCHTLQYDGEQKKTKIRKAVTRDYTIKDTAVEITSSTKTAKTVKRTVPLPQISQSFSSTNVNQIAKMFESGSAITNISKKINRVTPILTGNQRQIDQSIIKNLSKSLTENPFHYSLKELSTPPSTINADNIENSVNFLNLRQSNCENDLLFASKTSSSVNTIISSTIPSSLQVSHDNFATVSRNTADTCSNLKCNISTINNNNNFSSYPLSTVSSIEEILAERRFSRPLSAYSISDLLTDSPMPDDACIENFFRNLNKAI